MVTLVLPLPPAINATYKTTRSGGFYKARKAKDWEEEAMWEIKRQRQTRDVFQGPIYVGLVYHLKHQRDIDSMIKITLDILGKTKGNIIEDDMNIEHLIVKKCMDKTNPHVLIQIETL